METAQTTTTTHVVSFDIEGKFIADLARARVSEGAWEHGLSLLTDSMEGMSHEMAVLLLKGEADLTGWASDEEGIQFEKLKPTGTLAREMAERLDYLYGSTFQYNGVYWAPYAEVQGWNRDDYQWARTYPNYGHSLGFAEHERKHLWVLRSLYYANAPATDMVVSVSHPKRPSPTILLCKPAPMPPLWFKASRGDPVEFLSTVLAGGRSFPTRGANLDRQDFATAQAQSEPSDLEDDEPEAKKRTSRRAAPKAATPAEIAAVRSGIDDIEKLRGEATDIKTIGELTMRLETAIQAQEQRLPIDELEAVNSLRDRLDAQRLQCYGQAVRDQADVYGGYLEVPLLDENNEAFKPAQSLRVPRTPFLLWCLGGFDFEANGKERPTWSVVSPMGLKCQMDNPYHTDWMLGAGETFEDAYSHDKSSRWDIVQRSSSVVRYELTKEWTKAQFVVLSKGTRSWFSGEVVKPSPNKGVPAGSVAVVPFAGPQYQLAMETACRDGGVLIADTGGKLAHLAVVGREFGCTVLMLPGATKRFKEGQHLFIDMDEGAVYNQLI